MTSFDASVIEAFTALWQRTVILDWGAVFFATYLPFALVIAAIVLFFRNPSWRVRLWYILATALSVLLARGFFTELVRFVYARPRPFVELRFPPLLNGFDPSPAFPSGHAAAFFALAFVMLFIKRRWGYWFLGFAVLNALARVYAGVHWPTDVIAGAIVGCLSAGIVWFALLRNPGDLLDGEEEQEKEGEPERTLFPNVSA